MQDPYGQRVATQSKDVIPKQNSQFEQFNEDEKEMKSNTRLIIVRPQLEGSSDGHTATSYAQWAHTCSGRSANSAEAVTDRPPVTQGWRLTRPV